MNLHEWIVNRAHSFREGAKAVLREGADFEAVMEMYPTINDWDDIAKELDAEMHVEHLEITEAVEVAGYNQVDESIYEYVDFVPNPEQSSYSVNFIAHTSFINENAALIAGMQERMGASEFVVEKVEDGISMVSFANACGTPVMRRTHKITESPMTLWSIAPTPTESDMKRAAIRERIYGAE